MKKYLKTTLCFILCLIIPFSLCNSVYSLSKIGSQGAEVREIQSRLKKWKYYNGKIDGIYGTQTKNAVKKFQKNNNLTVDGVCGKKTLAKMGIYGLSNNSSSSSADQNLIARFITAEARGESYKGQVAVGSVILNRVKHASFPDSVSGVVYQNGAFDCVYNGQINQPTTESAKKAAKDALNGWDPTGGAIYYYNPKTAKSNWIKTRPVVAVIGNHIFCK
ncbi:MAG: spore cortex-lytic enzyme [Clostridia bacterium]|nr:spore cortex-lytic enzyme [Clostridia bacterium]